MELGDAVAQGEQVGDLPAAAANFPIRTHPSWLACAGAAVLCCAGPSLLPAVRWGAGGAALGAVLGGPGVVLAAALLLAASAAALLVARRSRR